MPPPRARRHRTYGVLVPNASLRSVVTALAPAAVPPAPAAAASSGEPCHRAASRYLWAMLLARIYEALPLSCPICHSQMRSIAFINDPGTVGKILNHIGESTQPPRVGHRCGWRRRNRRRTILSGVRQAIPQRRSDSISASPGRG